ATMLIFLRKARTISKKASIAGWLYRVAYRVALRTRTHRAERFRRENGEIDLATIASVSDPLWNDLQPVLDQELTNLSMKYRAAFVLCHLEGKTNEEAARELGCPVGTIYSRLAYARKRLRERLVRRGLAILEGTLATVVTPNVAQASAPAALLEATIKGCLSVTWGKVASTTITSKAVSLAEGALQAMYLSK